jgi:hypothetical protein
MAPSSYYGRMRATDADRDNVHAELQSAYADGRLTWDEFDARSTSLVQAKTYDQLASLTTDLRRPVPYRAASYQVRGAGATNAMAAISLACGIGQVFVPILGAIIAIVCGHVARGQLRRTDEQGAGMAVAGLVLGYLGIALPLLLTVIIVLALRG